MSEILLCNQSLNAQALQNHCGINLDQLSALSCEAPSLAAANTPYLIGDDHSGTGRGVCDQLAPAHVARLCPSHRWLRWFCEGLSSSIDGISSCGEVQITHESGHEAEGVCSFPQNARSVSQ